MPGEVEGEIRVRTGASSRDSECEVAWKNSCFRCGITGSLLQLPRTSVDSSWPFVQKASYTSSTHETNNSFVYLLRVVYSHALDMPLRRNPSFFFDPHAHLVTLDNHITGVSMKSRSGS